MAEFFGFEINRKGKDKEVPKVSFVPNTDGWSFRRVFGYGW